MDSTGLSPGGANLFGNTDQSSLERDYLRDTLWREEDHSRQLVEQIKRSRERIGNNDTPIETKKELRKKINSLNRRLKRSQKSIKAISGNLATLGPENQVISQSWPVESDYTRRLEAFHIQTVHDLQSQIQQLSLAVQNPLSPSSSISPAVPTTPVYFYSPVQSEGYSPLYSPFYGTSFQPFNYTSGQAFQQPSLRRYSAYAISPTSTVQQNDGTHPVFVQPTGMETLLDSQPVVLEPKPRTKSLPLTCSNGEMIEDGSPGSDDYSQDPPHRHSR